MLFKDSIAASCRYGDNAVSVFGPEALLIWEHSENDWQGFANILVKTTDGRFAHYEWTYGSCSGCDEWESSGLSDGEIEKRMRDAAAWFDDIGVLRRYLKLEDKEALYPTANDPKNGSIPGMLRSMGYGISEDFKAMGEAFEALFPLDTPSKEE